MKKILITSAIAFSALSFAYAEDASTTPPALPPVITTGSSTIDAQIRALRIEMEAKIKTVRDEYQAKLKAIIGSVKPVVTRPNGATTTVKEVRKEIKEVRKDNLEARKDARVQGESTTTVTLPSVENRKLMNFFRSFFGAPKN